MSKQISWEVSRDVERCAIEALVECRNRWHGNLWQMLCRLSVQTAWVRKVIGDTAHPDDRRLVAREVVLRSWAESDPDANGPTEFHRLLPELLHLADLIMPP